MPPSLTVERLSVTLGNRAVLSDVSFALEPGEICGLIGANGSGKTTLIRAILGLQGKSAGRITAGGAIGYVPQRLALDPDFPLRARDLVALGLDGHRFGLPLPNRARTAKVDAMLAAVGATSYANQRLGTLSGGQAQRVLIAHALIRAPRLLLLDEPLANLDIRAIAEIVALIRQLATTQRLTILISAHDMNPLLAAMDRVVYLARGRAATGTIAQIVRTEVLSALYGAHIDVIRVHGRLLVIAAAGPDEMPAVLDEHPDHVTAIP